MKTFTKILKWVVVLLVVVVISFVAFVYARSNRTFEAPYPDIHAVKDSAVIARGKYLVYGPAHCAECHAPTKDFLKVEQGQEIPLSGGMDFILPVGNIYAPNITPDLETGIGKLKDEEIARALRYGVKHNGAALIDFMPFYHISQSDLTAIISYLRSTPGVKNKRPAHEFNFMGKAVMALLIEPMGDGKADDAPAYDTTAAYGHYLAESVANCRGCHTKRDMITGAYIGTNFAGGTPIEVFDDFGKPIKGKHLVTPNLTPDNETGRIYGWTQEQFLSRFRQGRLLHGSPMPWGPFSRMSDTEIIALYKYLSKLDAVKNATPAGIQAGDPH
jgi:mono/diheme cytochrome c family protein